MRQSALGEGDTGPAAAESQRWHVDLRQEDLPEEGAEKKVSGWVHRGKHRYDGPNGLFLGEVLSALQHDVCNADWISVANGYPKA